MSIEQSDKEAAAFAKAPRVTLADIEAAIASRYDFTAASAVGAVTGYKAEDMQALGLLSICVLVLKNGFTIIGKSAPASPENFNAEFGKKLAYEDARQQMWPLMGFSLRDRLSQEPSP